MWRKTVEKVAEATFWANLCMNFDIFIYGEKIENFCKLFFSMILSKIVSIKCSNNYNMSIMHMHEAFIAFYAFFEKNFWTIEFKMCSFLFIEHWKSEQIKYKNYFLKFWIIISWNLLWFSCFLFSLRSKIISSSSWNFICCLYKNPMTS